MDKVQLAHEYALKALSGQIAVVEKAYLEGFNQALRIMKPIEIDGIEYYDFNLPSGTLWSMPLDNGEEDFWEKQDIKMSYYEASLYNLPTYEQFCELMEACDDRKPGEFLMPNGNRFYIGKVEGGFFWIKSEVENYHACTINLEREKVPTHTGEKRRVMLVKNKYSL